MSPKRVLALVALVLVVLGMIPSTAFAVEGKVFCVEDDGRGNFELSQMSITQGGAISADCYASWYDEKNPSVYSALHEAMMDEIVPIKSLTIASNLDFGGMESSTNACADASFKPLDISSRGTDPVLVTAINDAVIENLCYISENSDDGYYGFFGAVKNANISNLTFDNAYVAVSEPYSSSNIVKTYVGVLAGSIVASSVQNVTVKNSQVLGNYVGGLVGMAVKGSRISRFVGEGIRVSNDKDNSSTRDYVYLGGVVGELQDESSVSLSSLNLLNITSNAYGRQGFMGGVAGFVDGTYSTEEPVYDNYVMGTFFETKANQNNVGYAIGRVKYNSIGRLMHSVYYVIKSGTSSIPSDALDPSVIGSFEYGSKSLSTNELKQISEDHTFELNGETIISGVYKENINSTPFKNLGDKFVVQLNLSMSQDGFSGSGAWTRAEGLNDGYPFFANETYKAIEKVQFTFRVDAIDELPSGLRDEIRGYGSNNSSGELVIYLLTGNDKSTVADNSDESGKLTGERWQEIYENLENLGFLWVGDGTSISPFTASSDFSGGCGYVLTRPVPKQYVVTFDINVDKKHLNNVFFTDLYEGLNPKTVSEDEKDDIFDNVQFYRTDSCYTGWTENPQNKAFKFIYWEDVFQEDALTALDISVDKHGNETFPLYVDWKECEPHEPLYIELERKNCDDCQVKLVQTDANGVRYEHPFVPYGSGMAVEIPRTTQLATFHFTVEAEEAEKYKLVDQNMFKLWCHDGSVCAGPLNKDEIMVVNVNNDDENYKLTVSYKGKPLYLTFDENATGDIFYRNDWMKNKTYYEGSDDELPRIYRAGYCFGGWSQDKDGSNGPVFKNVKQMIEEGIADSVKMYAVWNEFDEQGSPCEAQTITMTGDGDGLASLALRLDNGFRKEYSLKPEPNKEYVYSISVPGFNDAKDFLDFYIVPEPESGFTLLRANLSPGNVDVSEDLKFCYEGQGLALQLMFTKNEKQEFVLDFDIEKNAIENTMYFADARGNYEYKTSDSLLLREYFPRVYDVERLAYIWSWRLDGGEEYQSFSPNLYDASSDLRKENKAIELVALWDNNAPMNTVFEIKGEKVENGSVNLVQVYNGKEIRHDMSEANVSLPQLDENLVYAFRLEAPPAKGFVLNKPIEVFVEVAGDTSFTLELKDGDLLVLSSLGRTASKLIRIKAEFEPAIEIAGGFREISEVELALSGKAVRYSVPSNVFDKDARARVSMQLLDALGNVIADTLLFEGDNPPEVINWERFPLAFGRYAFKSEILNGDEKIEFNRDFVVKNEIAEVCEGCWRMVGLSTVDLKNVDWSDAEFYWWNESRNFGMYWQYQAFTKSEKPVEGRGYWFNTEISQTLELLDTVPQPEGFVWKLDSVYSGWNMVSNPYSWYIDAYAMYMVEEDGAKNKADTAAVKFWRWDAMAGAYEPVQYLAPHEAVWAQTSREVTWEIPELPCYVTVLDEDGNLVPAPGLKSPVSLFKEAPAEDGFELRAVLADSKGRVDRWNVLGVASEEVRVEEPPQGMGDFVNLSVSESGSALATSVKKRSETDSYEWNLELKAADIRMGYLSFEGVASLRAKGLSLYVTVDGETTEVQDSKPLNFALGKNAKNANVYVASAPRKIASATLQGLKAVQMGRMLQVIFDADESLVGSEVRAELLSLQGQVLGAVSAKTLTGKNVLNLESPKSGVYMLRVKAGNRNAAGRVAVK